MLRYPKNATGYIQVPTSLLDIHGGRFGVSELREVVERHLGYGVYTAIRAYSIVDPVISDYTVDSSTITIAWPSFPGARYNIRVSDSENGIYSRHNDDPITNDVTGNIYSLEDLAAGTTYWIYVAFVDSDGNEHLPGIIGPQTDGIEFSPRPYKIGISTYPQLFDEDGVPISGPIAGTPVP